jgi:hypothetical protein
MAKLTFVFLATFLMAAIPASLRAQVYAEPVDAGQTLGTAAVTTGNSLTTITGTLSSNTDADLYKIDITSPTTFSATTDNSVTNAAETDTELFLFDSLGRAVASNDDTSGTSYTSTLPAGGTLTVSLSSGIYYLGISASGNEAVNAANDLIFSRDDQGYASTAVVGPATAVNSTVLAGFNSNAYDGAYLAGGYEIDLTGAAPAQIVASPEPSTWALLLFGGFAGTIMLRRPSRCA